MSDFYQILKREADSKMDNSRTNDRESFADKNDKIQAVEKPPLKKTFSVRKKTKESPVKKSSGNFRSNKKKIVSKKESEVKTKLNEYKRVILADEPKNPVWLTMAETAKLGGVKKRTVKRALRAGLLKYRIIEKRYLIDMRSAILYFHSRRKLWNKLENFGFGQYIKLWRD